MNFRPQAAAIEGFGARLNRIVEWLCAALIAAMVLVVWLGVAARYLSDGGISWAEELSRYLMIWAALLAVSCAAWWREHIGLDLLQGRLPAAARTVLRSAIDLVCIGFFLFMFWHGLEMTLAGREQYSTLFGLTMEWPFAAVPVSSALAAFQFAVRLVADLAGLERPHPAASPY